MYFYTFEEAIVFTNTSNKLSTNWHPIQSIETIKVIKSDLFTSLFLWSFTTTGLVIHAINLRAIWHISGNKSAICESHSNQTLCLSNQLIHSTICGACTKWCENYNHKLIRFQGRLIEVRITHDSHAMNFNSKNFTFEWLWFMLSSC